MAAEQGTGRTSGPQPPTLLDRRPGIFQGLHDRLQPPQLDDSNTWARLVGERLPNPYAKDTFHWWCADNGKTGRAKKYFQMGINTHLADAGRAVVAHGVYIGTRPTSDSEFAQPDRVIENIVLARPGQPVEVLRRAFPLIGRGAEDPAWQLVGNNPNDSSLKDIYEALRSGRSGFGIGPLLDRYNLSFITKGQIESTPQAVKAMVEQLAFPRNIPNATSA